MLTKRRSLNLAVAAVLALVAVLVAPVAPAGAVGGTVEFAEASTAVSEDAGAVAVSVTRSDTTDEMTVDYVVSGSNSGDFTVSEGTASGTITFPAGIGDASLTVTIVDDLDGEGGTESFSFTLQNPVNVTNPGDLFTVGTQDTHDLDITDDGDAGTIVFSSSTSSVSEADVDVVEEVSVTRTGGTEGAVSGTIESTGGTATSSDFTDVATTLSWADGEGSAQTVSVSITGDNVVEDSVNVELSVTATTGGAGGVLGSHLMTIDDDDAAGTIEMASATKSVSEDVDTVTVTFNRVGGVDGTVVAAYSTSDVSATEGEDYTASAGDVTFLQGETSQSVDITILDDLDDETAETFQVAITGDTTVVTITDNDDPLVANLDVYTVAEDTDLVTSFSALDNDTGPGGVDLAVVSFGTPTPGGTLSSIDLDAGTFTFTPTLNYSGRVSLIYEITDGTNTALGVIRINVTDDNTGPEAVADEFGLLSRIDPTNLAVLDNDIDQDDDELTVQTTTLTTAEGNAVDCTAGSLCTFTPATGFVGEDSFDYTAADPSGVTSTATVTVFVAIPRGCDAFATAGVTLEGTSGSDVLCGSSGDDIIDGMGGDDFILAGAGNDILRGGDGKDLLVGEAGNDLLAPGAGLNDDVIGGDGNDTVEYSGTEAKNAVATGADTVFVTETSISIDTINDEASPPVGVDDGDTHESVETVVFDGRGGDDIVTVQAGEHAAIDLRGGLGTDRLKYDTAGLEGVVDGDTAITATGRQPVYHTGFEIRQVDSFVRIGTEASDFWRISSQPLAEGLVLDQIGSGDTLEVFFGALLGPLEVHDSGEDVDGDDLLKVFGTDSADGIELRATSVRSDDETVSFRNIEELRVDGQEGDDVFEIDVVAAFRRSIFLATLLLRGGVGADTLVLTTEFDCTFTDSAIVVDGTQLDSVNIYIHPLGDFDVAEVEVIEYECGNGSGTKAVQRGYWIADEDGTVTGFGVTDFGDRTNPTSSVTGIDSLYDKQGYWTVEANGDVTAFGQAVDHGDLLALDIDPASPVVGISSLGSGDGYYLLGEDGGVFAFDAPFYGSTGDIALDLPVKAMDVAPGENGYWFVAADGGVFAYGPGAGFHGSLPEYVPYSMLAADIVGMATTASGNGYWLVAADGGVFAFGDAAFLGSVPAVLPGVTLAQPIVGIVATASGDGYWIVAADGGVFTFGDAPFLGAFSDPTGAKIVALAG